jgi:hypothetical protein
MAISKPVPLIVFISCSQKEFEEFRKHLKEAIDEEEFRFSGSRMMKAELIEERRGDVIPEDIKKGLENCSIYVGIFGRVFSEWTKAEYLEARANGLPLLIYYVKKQIKPGRPSRQEARGRKSKVEQFLETEIKKFRVRVRGPYRKEEKLYDVILNDLAYEISELVREATSIRRTIHKGLAPP